MQSRTSLVVLLGALLGGAPLFSQTFSSDPQVSRNELVWFRLTETQSDIRDRMGAPHFMAEFGADFVSWQYQIGEIDNHDHSHVLVFRKSTGKLVSVTRSYEPERLFDNLFPAAVSTVHHYPNAAKPQYSATLRHLSGDRVLLAMGVSRPGQPVGQLVLMHRGVLRAFYPWLDEQLAAPTPPNSLLNSSQGPVRSPYQPGASGTSDKSNGK